MNSLYDMQPSMSSIDRVLFSPDTVDDLRVRLEVVQSLRNINGGLHSAKLESYDTKHLVRLYSFRQLRSGAEDQIAVVLGPMSRSCNIGAWPWTRVCFSWFTETMYSRDLIRRPSS
jgi:hypothetical protein